MPLVVPILRLAMLFLNIYESYKTLKKPRPSSRNGGNPTLRALSQRKRDMKGCLAVWIVWCCFMIYERVAEGIISLFIPFYEEFKSLAVLFLILTRARGAEPIYLHVIRPLLKPYTTTVDAILDIVRMFGDIIFILLTAPIHHALAWWKTTFVSEADTLDSESEGRQKRSTSGQRPRTLKRNSTDQQPRTRASGEATRQSRDNTTPETPADAIYEQSAQEPRNAVPTPPLYEVWHPQTTSRDDDDNTTASGDLPDHLVADEGLPVQVAEVEEWRKYPAFPSAYPPTPLVLTRRLFDNESGVPSSAHSVGSSSFPPITELVEELPQQDFRQSLLSQRKPLNPGFVRGLSDDSSNSGVQRGDDGMAVDDPDEYESTDGDSEVEDDFDITLRTPLRLAPTHRLNSLHQSSRGPSSIASSSTRSQVSVLTTARTGSSLRTAVSSITSSNASSAVSSPLETSSTGLSDDDLHHGTKRPFRRASSNTTIRTRLTKGDSAPVFREGIAKRITRRRISAHGRRTLTQTRSSTLVAEIAVSELSTSDADSENVEGGEVQVERLPPAVKRRKVTVGTARVVNPARASRPRVGHLVSPTTKRARPLRGEASSTSLRTSTRLRSGTVTNTTPMGTSQELTDVPTLSLPDGKNWRNGTRRK